MDKQLPKYGEFPEREELPIQTMRILKIAHFECKLLCIFCQILKKGALDDLSYGISVSLFYFLFKSSKSQAKRKPIISKHALSKA